MSLKNANEPVSRTDALRASLDRRRPAVAMAAHNPLAAKLAAEAGFDAIWGSGFEFSASYAPRHQRLHPELSRSGRRSPPLPFRSARRAS